MELGKSKKQFCSRLVAQAYAAAGINLVKSPDYCSPGDLKRCTLLRPVPDATRAAATDEICAVSNVVDTTQIMRDATNKVLEGARRLNPLIESLNDIDEHLRVQHDLDAPYLKCFVDSGYLDVWQIECANKPWEYDLHVMTVHPWPDDVKASYCVDLLRHGEKGTQHLEINRAGYTIFAEQTGLQTFFRLKALYEKLVEVHKQRFQVARQWLERHSPDLVPVIVEPLNLEPHTAEWFEALGAWNPTQAVMTRTVVDGMGRMDVCSTCGDDPAKIYRLIDPPVPVGAVHTLRLCNDCWAIRRRMYAECMALE